MMRLLLVLTFLQLAAGYEYIRRQRRPQLVQPSMELIGDKPVPQLFPVYGQQERPRIVHPMDELIAERTKHLIAHPSQHLIDEAKRTAELPVPQLFPVYGQQERPRIVHPMDELIAARTKHLIAHPSQHLIDEAKRSAELRKKITLFSNKPVPQLFPVYGHEERPRIVHPMDELIGTSSIVGERTKHLIAHPSQDLIDAAQRKPVPQLFPVYGQQERPRIVHPMDELIGERTKHMIKHPSQDLIDAAQRKPVPQLFPVYGQQERPRIVHPMDELIAQRTKRLIAHPSQHLIDEAKRTAELKKKITLYSAKPVPQLFPVYGQQERPRIVHPTDELIGERTKHLIAHPSQDLIDAAKHKPVPQLFPVYGQQERPRIVHPMDELIAERTKHQIAHPSQHLIDEAKRTAELKKKITLYSAKPVPQLFPVYGQQERPRIVHPMDELIAERTKHMIAHPSQHLIDEAKRTAELRQKITLYSAKPVPQLFPVYGQQEIPRIVHPMDELIGERTKHLIEHPSQHLIDEAKRPVELRKKIVLLSTKPVPQLFPVYYGQQKRPKIVHPMDELIGERTKHLIEHPSQHLIDEAKRTAELRKKIVFYNAKPVPQLFPVYGQQERPRIVHPMDELIGERTKHLIAHPSQHLIDESKRTAELRKKITLYSAKPVPQLFPVYGQLERPRIVHPMDELIGERTRHLIEHPSQHLIDEAKRTAEQRKVSPFKPVPKLFPVY